MFYGVSEPISHYQTALGGVTMEGGVRTDWAPLGGAQGNEMEARRLGMAATIFHWGLHPWAIYAIVALALALFAYNKGLPLTMRSIFYPLLGERVWGWPGHVIDVLAVFATIFGLATSLGFGAEQATAGLNFLFGISNSNTTKIILIVCITGIATMSVVLGVEKGVKRLSEINMVLALVLLLFIIFFGPTIEIFRGFFGNLGAYARELVPLSNPFGRSDDNFRQGWTAFYWAWWISWSPFVGMFIARVSRGRTVRQFLIAVLIVPSVISILWMTALGGTAITMTVGGFEGIADAALELKLFQMLGQLPLTSITSWSEYSHDTAIDPDGVALRDYFYNTTGDISAFSQELRLQGEMGNLTWIIGGNYAREKTYQQDDAGPYDQSTSAYNFVDAGLGGPFFVYSQYARQKFVNKAIFANVDYDIGDLVTLHGGIRYTDTDIDFVGCTADRGDALGQGIENLLNFIRSGAGLDPITIADDACVTIDSSTLTAVEVTDKLDEDNVSWRAGIDLKPSPDALVYASVSRGFKSGSFPLLSASDANQFSPVTQESVTAYEIGTKLTVLDRTAQINAAVFYYDYADKQFKGRVVANPDIFGPLEALVNVPKSEVKGAELQLDLAPTDGLRFSIGATYLDTKIKGSFVNYDSYGNQVDFAGSSFPYTPKYQVLMDGQYEWAASDSISPYIGANLSFQSDSKAVLGDARATPSDDLTSRGGLTIDDYVLIDLRAGLKLAEKYKIGAFVRNLTNEYYWNNAARITDTTVRYAGRPRTYGVTVSASF